MAVYMLGVVMLAASSAAVFHFVVADPGKVKDIMGDSGAYSSIVDTLLDSAAQETKDPISMANTHKSEAEIPFAKPEIQNIVKKAFAPKVLQSSSEKIIDGTYDWLHGQTEQAEFTLDLSQSKDTLARGIGNYVRQRAAKLPSCSYGSISRQIDAFDADCLPQGVTPAQIGAQTTRDIKSDKNFLANTKVTPDNIFGKNTQDNPFKSQDLPGQFQLAYNLLWILLAVAAVLGAAAIWLNVNRLEGLGKVSKTLLIIGVFTAMTPFLLNFALNRLSGSGFGNPTVDDIALPLLEQFISAVSVVYFVFGGACAALGAAGLIFVHKNKDGEHAGSKSNARPSS